MGAIKLSTLVLATAVLGACASAQQVRARQDAELARFEQHAGEPIREIRTFAGVDQWQSLSPLKLVIWTSVNRAFLLSLRAPCSGLEFQQAIAVTSSNGIISARFDKVQFENQTCFIEQIQPVDYKAMKAQRRAEKSAGD